MSINGSLAEVQRCIQHQPSMKDWRCRMSLVSVIVLFALHSMIHMACHASRAAHHFSSYNAAFSLIIALLCLHSIRDGQQRTVSLTRPDRSVINVVSAGHLPRTIVHDASGASTEWTIIVRCYLDLRRLCGNLHWREQRMEIRHLAVDLDCLHWWVYDAADRGTPAQHPQTHLPGRTRFAVAVAALIVVVRLLVVHENNRVEKLWDDIHRPQEETPKKQRRGG